MKAKIIDRIRKLFASAESEKAIGNEAAAALFAQKVQQLLDAHNLTLSDIELERARGEDIAAERVNLVLQKIEAWQCHLLQEISVLNGCMSLDNEAGYQIVVGRASDRAVVIEFYRYFERLAWDLAEKAVKTHREERKNWFYRDAEKYFDEYRKSFLAGFAVRVGERLQAGKVKPAGPVNENALVFAGGKFKESLEYTLNKFQVDDVRRGERPRNREGFQQGEKTGDRVALTNKAIE